MGSYTVEDQKDLSIPEGMIVRATLQEIVEKQISWVAKSGPDQGKTITKTLLAWWWEVQGERFTKDDGTQRRVKGECEARITNHPNNKFAAWASALLNRSIGVGTPIDTDDLVGISADITVLHRKDKNDPSKVYEEVDSVIAVETFDEPPF